MGCGPFSPPTHHDAFRHGGGLGKTALVLLRLLDCQDGQSARELADTQGLSSASWTGKVLRRMEEVGLAYRDGDGLWTRPSHPDLDRAAREVETAGKGARQRRRQKKEQEERDEEVLEWKRRQMAKKTSRSEDGSDGR